MPIIERIHSIASKLGVTIKGETISELLASLEEAVSKRDDNKFQERPDYSKKQDYSRKFRPKKEDDE